MTSGGTVMRWRSLVLVVFMTSSAKRVRARTNKDALVPEDIRSRPRASKRSQRGRPKASGKAEVGRRELSPGIVCASCTRETLAAASSPVSEFGSSSRVSGVFGGVERRNAFGCVERRARSSRLRPSSSTCRRIDQPAVRCRGACTSPRRSACPRPARQDFDMGGADLVDVEMGPKPSTFFVPAIKCLSV